MKKIILSTVVVKGAGEDGKDVELSAKAALIAGLQNAGMRQARLEPPFFPALDSLAQLRMVGKILSRLDEAGDDVVLSNEEHDLVRKVMEANIYLSARAAFVFDLIEKAEDVKE